MIGEPRSLGRTGLQAKIPGNALSSAWKARKAGVVRNWSSGIWLSRERERKPEPAGIRNNDINRHSANFVDRPS